MNDPARILAADHREAQRLIDLLVAGSPGGDRDQLVNELNTLLVAHLDMEDSIVEPSAEPTGRVVRSAQVRRDLRSLLAVDEAGFCNAIETLRDAVAEHVSDVEHDLLPSVRTRIGVDEWHALGDALVREQQAAGQPAL